MSQANRGRAFLQSWQELSRRYECRGTKWLEGCEVVMVFQNCLGGKAQCRGRTCLGARNLSWLQELDCGQCAYPGAALIPELSWQQEPLRKNRDKQLTFIVRVSCWGLFLISLIIVLMSDGVGVNKACTYFKFNPKLSDKIKSSSYYSNITVRVTSFPLDLSFMKYLPRVNPLKSILLTLNRVKSFVPRLL